MIIYYLVLFLAISAVLSYLLRKQSAWVNVVLQIFMAILFFYSAIIWRSTPSSIHNKKEVTSKHFTINLVDEKNIETLTIKDYDRFHPKQRLALYPYFDDNGVLQVEQKIVSRNIGGICKHGISSNDNGSITISSETLYMKPRIDLEYCKAELKGKLGDRILVAMENDKIKWKYSLLVTKEVRKRLYYDLNRVIGIGDEFIILLNYDGYEITILSSKTGKVVYPKFNSKKYEFKEFGPAAYDSKRNIVYKVNNDYGDNSASKLMQVDITTGETKELYKFPVQGSPFFIGSGVPSQSKSVFFLSKLNLLVIFNETSSYGTTNSQLYVYSIDDEKMIFKNAYQPYVNPKIVVNQKDSSFGVYYKKHLQHFKVTKNK